MNSQATPPNCDHCSKPIVGDPVDGFSRFGERIVRHRACSEEVARLHAEHDRRAREKVLAANVERVSRAFDANAAGKVEQYGAPVFQLPEWPWARFDNPEFRERASSTILGAVECWDPAKVRTILLMAPTGRGKTAGPVAWLYRHRAHTIARARAGDDNARHRQFVFGTGAEIAIARRKTAYGQEAPLIAAAMKANLLLLDDLGGEIKNEAVLEIVDHRYRRQAATIVSTFLKPEGFRKHYGDALWRRLTESGVVVEDFPGG